MSEAHHFMRRLQRRIHQSSHALDSRGLHDDARLLDFIEAELEIFIVRYGDYFPSDDEDDCSDND